MLNLIYQNDSRLSKDIQEVGCFFRSSLAIIELKMNKTFSVNEINKMWEESIKDGYIKNRIMCVGAAPILNKAIQKMGGGYKAIEVGTSRQGVKTFYKGCREEYKQSLVYICKYKTYGTQYGTHFVVVDGEGNIIFDPYKYALGKKPKYKEIYTIMFHIIKL